MKRYISELRQKPHAHRRRFALLAAGGFTAAIFLFWVLAHFGAAKVAKDTTGPVNLAAVTSAESTPFGNILHGIESTWESLKSFNINGR